MDDFTFHNPTKIIFGRKKEETIGEVLANDKITKVLLIYGQHSIKQSGLYDRILASLHDHSIDYIEFGGVVSNPVLSHTLKGARLAKKEQVGAILAVGGGSVIDEGKAIAVGATVDDDLWNYFTGATILSALPIYTVLTLAATGSEMNCGAVVTNEETKQKYNIMSPLLYPRISILNPELTCSVPANYSAYGAVDAIAHVIEAYFTKDEGPLLLDRIVESIIKTVISTNNIIRNEPDNYEARAEFMWTATLALNGLTTTGVKGFNFPNHMIEHSLSAIYNIAHGAGLAIVIPAWMRWYSQKNPSQFKRFSQKIFNLQSVDAGIEALENWFSALGAPTRLKDLDIPPTDISIIAENAHGLARQWGIDKIYSKDIITEILTLAV